MSSGGEKNFILLCLYRQKNNYYFSLKTANLGYFHYLYAGAAHEFCVFYRNMIFTAKRRIDCEFIP
jgi:hypothetical protein